MIRKCLAALRWVASLRRCLVFLLFLGFAACFGTGVLRLYMYDLPMARGDYQTAATEAVMFGHTPDESELPSNGLSGDSADQRFWNSVIAGFHRYQDWVCGDRVAAKWNLALDLYRQEKWSDARQAFQKSFAACCDEGGEIRPQYREKGSMIQVMIGNTFDQEQKTKEAYPFYEAALSTALNPSNKVAIYNLERLQDAKSGGGQGDKGKEPKGGDQKGTGPGKPARKL